MKNFAGRWLTTFGPMELRQKKSKVSGTYGMEAAECFIEGTVENDRLNFRYREPQAEGEGWFELLRPGKFAGRWRPDDEEQWSDWTGQRGFEGIWETTFGPMRLFHEEDGRVYGCYEGVGQSTIEGVVTDDHLEFTYEEPQARGTGAFELAEDGRSFIGQWQAEGSGFAQSWQGYRLLPEPNVLWLVVLEAHWQTHLRENEYAFGNMLREFFARVPHVRVRQRYFTNAEGLEKWCREVMYLAEPAILVVASHGTPEGLSAYGQLISGSVLEEGLRYADNLQLVHLSSCLTLENGESSAICQALAGKCPVSGYATSVDWAASAMTEFLFLDMILSKGLSAGEAAEQLVHLLPFAGDEGLPDSPYPAAGFRFVPARKGELLLVGQE